MKPRQQVNIVTRRSVNTEPNETVTEPAAASRTAPYCPILGSRWRTLCENLLVLHDLGNLHQNLLDSGLLSSGISALRMWSGHLHGYSTQES
ncbi:hypothetical protein GDO78_019301 [Eleutherodactylus coqui]|uniref:Uncharacterized protein n=1 Tax=Eleutherodactylus coqui TaxID=57060 RepID=A0A8J6C6L9_ELECQ|nr:hypothetical protein GDO78_019301 [Eleutherodactylus coqui]